MGMLSYIEKNGFAVNCVTDYEVTSSIVDMAVKGLNELADADKHEMDSTIAMFKDAMNCDFGEKLEEYYGFEGRYYDMEADSNGIMQQACCVSNGKPYISYECIAVLFAHNIVKAIAEDLTELKTDDEIKKKIIIDIAEKPYSGQQCFFNECIFNVADKNMTVHRLIDIFKTAFEEQTQEKASFYHLAEFFGKEELEKYGYTEKTRESDMQTFEKGDVGMEHKQTMKQIINQIY